MANEFGRLAQGNGPTMPTGTETIFFISHRDVPKNKVPTYCRIVCEEKPLKAETKRVRITVGGNRIEYAGDVATPGADLITVKCLLNSVVSTPGAKCLAADAANFYLGTPLPGFEYMRIPVKIIPACIMKQYNLYHLVHNGYVMVEIRKGMYGLPQAGILANRRLVKHLAKSGYHEMPRTPGLFRHETRPVTFCLVVDDFGIKYVGKEHADHLLATLRTQYTMTTDWDCTNYCGLTIKWDYTARTCDISLPGYIERALHRFQHLRPKRRQHAPYAAQIPTYGAAQQLTLPEDLTATLDPAGILRLQEIVGTLLYYARAVDSTMLAALGSIASANTSEATADAITQLLNYAATNPEATVRYIASDMCLKIHSDASYLSEPKARSRVAGHHFLSSFPKDPNTPPTANDVPPPHNGAIHTLCQILKVVVSSATEAELGAAFFNAKDGVTVRITLEEMGHPQPPTPLQVDNSCAVGIINNTVKQRRSKAIDMRFYWLKDRECQQQFQIFWRKGSDNLADYFTKHHSPTHHRRMRSTYLHVASHLFSRPNFTPKLGNVSGEGVLIGAPPSHPGYPQKHTRALTAAQSYNSPTHKLI
jgi:hypothetical protein